MKTANFGRNGGPGGTFGGNWNHGSARRGYGIHSVVAVTVQWVPGSEIGLQTMARDHERWASHSHLLNNLIIPHSMWFGDLDFQSVQSAHWMGNEPVVCLSISCMRGRSETWRETCFVANTNLVTVQVGLVQGPSQRYSQSVQSGVGQCVRLLKRPLLCGFDLYHRSP